MSCCKVLNKYTVVQHSIFIISNRTTDKITISVMSLVQIKGKHCWNDIWTVVTFWRCSSSSAINIYHRWSRRTEILGWSPSRWLPLRITLNLLSAKVPMVIYTDWKKSCPFCLQMPPPQTSPSVRGPLKLFPPGSWNPLYVIFLARYST